MLAKRALDCFTINRNLQEAPTGMRVRRCMQQLIAAYGVTVEVPDNAEVGSDGTIYAPNGLDFSVYVEPVNIAVDCRKAIIEGRSPVSSYGAVEETPDGWLIRFETEDGELGFELGRRRPDRCVVFWTDRITDADALERALAISREATLS